MARWHHFRQWRSGIHHVQEMAVDIIKVVEAVDVLEERGMLEPVGRAEILKRLEEMSEALQKKLEKIRSFPEVSNEIEDQPSDAAHVPYTEGEK